MGPIWALYAIFMLVPCGLFENGPTWPAQVEAILAQCVTNMITDQPYRYWVEPM